MWNTFNNWLFRLAMRFTARRIVRGKNLLTPEYLKNKGWITDGIYWFEPNIKERDIVRIRFHAYWYEVWLGPNIQFFVQENSIEWFEMFYMLAHPDNGRYDIAGFD